MKKFWKPLRKLTMMIIVFEKRKWSKNNINHIFSKKICHICKKKFKDKYTNYKKYVRVRDYFHYICNYRGAAHSKCNLKYIIPKDIYVVFHNGSNYDYHFTIKELAKELERELNCFRENTEKYKIFPVLVQKEVKRIKKEWRRNYKNHLTSYNLLISSDLWKAH